MEQPDWYPDWRHDAFHELQEKNARLNAEFRIREWPLYDCDLDAGTLTLSKDGLAKVIAEIQMVGSTSEKAGNWLWGWGNSHWPEDIIVDAEKVRRFGEEHGICELTHRFLESDSLNDLGWELAGVAARVTGAVGAYRPPRDDGGGLFLIYRSIGWAS